jgi:transcriptional regulator with XRE-family HTH domain
MREFGLLIRGRRRQLGLDTDVVAAAVGLSTSRYQSIETGYSARGLTPKQLLALARALQMSVEELVSIAAANEVA